MKFSLSVAAVVAMASSAVHAQVGMWGQCGGNGYSGSTTCVSGAYCSKINDWYSQCLPGGPSSTTSTSTSTFTPPVVTNPPTTTTSDGTPGPTSTGAPGVCPTLGSNLSLTANSNLPDPFTFFNGQKVTTKTDWECRAKEISELFQRYELGTFPPKPSSVTGSYSGGTLTVNVSEGGKSISFTVRISGNSGSNVPAIIAYGAASIPIPSGVATITFNNDDIAAQQNSGSRGSGKFYTIYGSGHSASALTAWAWGVDRIIDALEVTTGHNINVKRIGVTGCSRNGKGAIVAGALVKRVALTIPQESGSGGSACWRLSDYQKSQGQNVQTAQQIITENVWFSKEFEKYVNQVNRLPFDHHMLAGLVAPRGLYIAENTDMEWLGNLSSYGCPKVGRKIYEALGVPDNMGVSQIGGHNHCSFPSGQNSELTAFINKFLKDQSANTNILRTDGRFNFPEAQFVNWSVPNLS